MDSCWEVWFSMKNFAGLASTCIIVFYILSYDVAIKSQSSLLVYYLFLGVTVLSGDIILAYYSYEDDESYFTCGIMILWAILDGIFVFMVYYRRSSGAIVRLPFTRHNLFLVVTRTEVIFAIFVPIFTNPDMTMLTSNNIAFFIILEAFSSYYDQFDQWNRPGLLKFMYWTFSLSTVTATLMEWLHLANSHSENEDVIFERASYVFEWFAGGLIYFFIILQFQVVKIAESNTALLDGQFHHHDDRNYQSHDSEDNKKIFSRNVSISQATNLKNFSSNDENADVENFTSSA